MRLRRRNWLFGALAIMLAASATRPAMAQENEDRDEAKPRTRIHIERNGGAEGEETVGRHHIVFFDQDGEIQEIEGEGSGFSWVDGEGGRHYRMHGPGFALREGAFLGVSTTRLSPELRSHFGAPESAGVMISKIVEDSAAFTAGLRVGDIITSVEGEAIESPRDLFRAIRSREEGDTVTVEVYRDGQVQALSAILAKTEYRAFDFEGAPPFPHLKHFGRGIKVACEEEGGDCDVFLSRHLDICDDAQECEVNISCAVGSCTCTVNGEETECKGLRRLHERRLQESE